MIKGSILSGVATLSFLRFLKLQGAFLVILRFSESLHPALKEFLKHRALYAHLVCGERGEILNDTGKWNPALYRANRSL